MNDLPTTRVISIDGTRIRSMADAHETLARGLKLPKHYGRNLDALFDCLTTEVPGPLVIEWHSSITTMKALAADFDRLRKTLEDAARTRADLAVAFF